ncbi:hypothetical protein EVAR_10834_1 [Eumeta japonica]|uniref:Uncharacterized protein n=1 Tax=Eumeta variegata TaxID=151549 RepID=A0A4C1Y815_EUMVA|nr:hypothetical protein EVAR_10834_1 [Eumeta japonica]
MNAARKFCQFSLRHAKYERSAIYAGEIFFPLTTKDRAQYSAEAWREFSNNPIANRKTEAGGDGAARRYECDRATSPIVSLKTSIITIDTDRERTSRAAIRGPA